MSIVVEHLIIGYGSLGQALHRSALLEQNVEILDLKFDNYDNNYKRFKKMYKFKNMWICLPDDSCSYEVFENYIEEFSPICEFIYILSSIDFKIPKYEDKLIRIPIFNEERLLAKGFIDKYVIVGTDFPILVEIFKKLPYFKVIANYSFEEANMIKLFHNVYSAYNILFWNFIFQNCSKDSINYENVIEAFQKINKFPIFNTQYAKDGLPGYGGKCLPKDVNKFSGDLPEFMKNYNDKLRYSDV